MKKHRHLSKLNRLHSLACGVDTDFTDKRRYEIFQQLYEHGKLNKDSPPLRVRDVEDIARKCGNKTCKVYLPKEYEELAEKNEEPCEAVLFVKDNDQAIGHFVGVFTDPNNKIHYGDSFGHLNKVSINPEGRSMIVSKPAVQAETSSNCGWLSLLYALTHNKMRPIDRNPN